MRAFKKRLCAVKHHRHSKNQAYPTQEVLSTVANALNRARMQRNSDHPNLHHAKASHANTQQGITPFGFSQLLTLGFGTGLGPITNTM